MTESVPDFHNDVNVIIDEHPWRKLRVTISLPFIPEYIRHIVRIDKTGAD